MSQTDTGRYNRRITILQPLEGSDEGAQPLQGFVPLISLWANVLYQSGSETLRNDGLVASSKASVRIKYRTGFDTRMRIQLGDVLFNIINIQPDEVMRDHVDFVCETIP